MRISYALTMSIVIILAVEVTGCTKHDPVPPPMAARNPHSTEMLSLSLTYPESGYFDRIEAQAFYVIVNERECSPKDHSQALGGRWNHVFEEIDLPVTKFGEDEFHVEAPRRPFLDADYYALGICRWELDGVHFKMHRSGRAGHIHTINTNPAWIDREKVRSSLCPLNPRERNSTCIGQAAVKSELRNLYFPVTIKLRKD